LKKKKKKPKTTSTTSTTSAFAGVAFKVPEKPPPVKIKKEKFTRNGLFNIGLRGGKKTTGERRLRLLQEDPVIEDFLDFRLIS